MGHRSWNDGLSLEVLIVALMSFIWTITGLDANIKTITDCGKTFDLREHGEVNIKVAGHVFIGDFDRCRITVEQEDTPDYPRVCITPVTVDLGGCSVEVDVHNGYFISDRYEDKQYTCRSTSYEEECTYLDGQVIVFRRVLDDTSHLIDHITDNRLNIHLKVYSKKSEWATSNDSGGSGGLELRYILMIIGGSCSFLSCLCGMCYKCSKYNAASRGEEAAGYPAVQYQTATQGDTGYQPSEGFQKTGFNDTRAGLPPSYEEALAMKNTAPT